MDKYTVMPSIISCDLCNLEQDIKKLEEAGVQALHIDILDGNFSPSMPIGVDTYIQLSKKTNLDFDVHIMSCNNEFFINKAIEMNAKRICFEVEGEKHIAKRLLDIKSKGIKAGLAFAPATSVESVKDILPLCDFILLMRIEPGFAFAEGGKLNCIETKIAETRKLLDKINPDIQLVVDGRVSFDDVKPLTKMGVNNLVAGSKSMFVSRNYKENFEKILKELK